MNDFDTYCGNENCRKYIGSLTSCPACGWYRTPPSEGIKLEPLVGISVYLDDGRVFEYEVANQEKAREHTAAIVTTGYRSCRDGVLEHYPPHRILKVKAAGGIETNYPDRVRGT